MVVEIYLDSDTNSIILLKDKVVKEESKLDILVLETSEETINYITRDYFPRLGYIYIGEYLDKPRKTSKKRNRSPKTRGTK